MKQSYMPLVIVLVVALVAIIGMLTASGSFLPPSSANQAGAATLLQNLGFHGGGGIPHLSPSKQRSVSGCVDTDGGSNLYVAGNTSVAGISYTDQCLAASSNPNLLLEYFCNPSGNASYDIIDCHTYGMVCSNGACVRRTAVGGDFGGTGSGSGMTGTPGSGTSNEVTVNSGSTPPGTCANVSNPGAPCGSASSVGCTDSDAGFNIFKPGIVAASDGTHTDYCNDNKSVVEYYCINNQGQEGGSPGAAGVGYGWRTLSCGYGQICTDTPGIGGGCVTSGGGTVSGYGTLHVTTTPNHSPVLLYSGSTPSFIGYAPVDDVLQAGRYKILVENTMTGTGGYLPQNISVTVVNGTTTSVDVTLQQACFQKVAGTTTISSGGSPCYTQKCETYNLGGATEYDYCKNDATAVKYYCAGATITSEVMACGNMYPNCYDGTCTNLTIRNTPVNVDSTPSGASVIINNMLRGTTPLDGYLLSPGYTYTMTVSKSGYADNTTSFYLTDKGASFNVVLQPTGTQPVTTTTTGGTCTGYAPLAAALGVIRGPATYSAGYATTAWTYSMWATTTTPCLWKCASGYTATSGGCTMATVSSSTSAS